MSFCFSFWVCFWRHWLMRFLFLIRNVWLVRWLVSWKGSYKFWLVHSCFPISKRWRRWGRCCLVRWRRRWPCIRRCGLEWGRFGWLWYSGLILFIFIMRGNGGRIWPGWRLDLCCRRRFVFRWRERGRGHWAQSRLWNRLCWRKVRGFRFRLVWRRGRSEILGRRLFIQRSSRNIWIRGSIWRFGWFMFVDGAGRLRLSLWYWRFCRLINIRNPCFPLLEPESTLFSMKILWIRFSRWLKCLRFLRIMEFARRVFCFWFRNWRCLSFWLHCCFKSTWDIGHSGFFRRRLSSLEH